MEVLHGMRWAKAYRIISAILGITFAVLAMTSLMMQFSFAQMMDKPDMGGYTAEAVALLNAFFRRLVPWCAFFALLFFGGFYGLSKKSPMGLTCVYAENILLPLGSIALPFYMQGILDEVLALATSIAGNSPALAALGEMLRLALPMTGILSAAVSAVLLGLNSFYFFKRRGAYTGKADA